MERTNVEGTGNLLQRDGCGVRGVREHRFVVRVRAEDHPPDESEPLEPNSDYAETKASATELCRSMAVQHQLPLCTLRLYSVYGPYEEPTRLMPRLIVHGRRGTLPELVDARTARDFIDVNDVVRAYLLAAASATQEPGGVYNVGSGVQTTVGEAVAIARRALGITAEPQWLSMTPRSWDTQTWVANITRIRARLHWQPTRSLPQGFEAMVQWYEANPQLWPRYDAAIDAAR